VEGTHPLEATEGDMSGYRKDVECGRQGALTVLTQRWQRDEPKTRKEGSHRERNESEHRAKVSDRQALTSKGHREKDESE
jgi:hypothetical protein